MVRFERDIHNPMPESELETKENISASEVFLKRYLENVESPENIDPNDESFEDVLEVLDNVCSKKNERLVSLGTENEDIVLYLRYAKDVHDNKLLLTSTFEESTGKNFDRIFTKNSNDTAFEEIETKGMMPTIVFGNIYRDMERPEKPETEQEITQGMLDQAAREDQILEDKTFEADPNYILAQAAAYKRHLHLSHEDLKKVTKITGDRNDPGTWTVKLPPLPGGSVDRVARVFS